MSVRASEAVAVEAQVEVGDAVALGAVGVDARDDARQRHAGVVGSTPHRRLEQRVARRRAHRDHDVAGPVHLRRLPLGVSHLCQAELGALTVGTQYLVDAPHQERGGAEGFGAVQGQRRGALAGAPVTVHSRRRARAVLGVLQEQTQTPRRRRRAPHGQAPRVDDVLRQQRRRRRLQSHIKR